MGNRVLIGPGNDPDGHFLHLRKFLSLNSKLFRDRPETRYESSAECSLVRSSGGAVVSGRISRQKVRGSVPVLYKPFCLFLILIFLTFSHKWEDLGRSPVHSLISYVVPCEYKSTSSDVLRLFPRCSLQTVSCPISCPSICQTTVPL